MKEDPINFQDVGESDIGLPKGDHKALYDKLVDFLRRVPVVRQVIAFLERPMTPSLFLRISLSITIGLLVCGMLLIFIVDPFFHYRQKGIGAQIFDRRLYKIPGVLRYFDYDTLMLGASTSQNFDLGDFRRLMGMNAVKASPDGCRFFTAKLYFDMAKEARGNQLKNVVQSIDMVALFRDPNTHRDPPPDYLYDKGFRKDYYYWWNFDILREIGQYFIIYFRSEKFIRKETSRDLMFNNDIYRRKNYGFEEVRKTLADEKEMQGSLLKIKSAFPGRNPELNVEQNMLSSVRANPDITFTIFTVPFLGVLFSAWDEEGSLENVLKVREMLAEKFLQYPNIRFFDFQHDRSIVSDVSLFKDLHHYDAATNKKMVEYMASGTFQIKSVEQMREHNQIIREIAKEQAPLLKKLLEKNVPAN